MYYVKRTAIHKQSLTHKQITYFTRVDRFLAPFEAICNLFWHHTIQEFLALSSFQLKFLHVLFQGSALITLLQDNFVFHITVELVVPAN